jgi:hypothetical protein
MFESDRDRRDLVSGISFSLLHILKNDIGTSVCIDKVNLMLHMYLLTVIKYWFLVFV